MSTIPFRTLPIFMRQLSILRRLNHFCFTSKGIAPMILVPSLYL
jgi:hypothetical protein